MRNGNYVRSSDVIREPGPTAGSAQTASNRAEAQPPRDAGSRDGGAGNDVLIGTRGNDTLNGGAGNDRLLGGAGSDRLEGGAGIDRLFGGSGRDLLNGGSGNDLLSGGSNSDVLRGGTGRDLLGGGSGDDLLFGGRDNDVLVGGSGSDRFAFASGDGNDIVRDFAPGADILDFSQIAGTPAVNVAQRGRDTVVSVDDVNVTLQGVTASQLSAANFRGATFDGDGATPAPVARQAVERPPEPTGPCDETEVVVVTCNQEEGATLLCVGDVAATVPAVASDDADSQDRSEAQSPVQLPDLAISTSGVTSDDGLIA